MPIETDSEGWQEAERPDRKEALVVDFLSSNPNKAYRVREIADEVIGTNWDEVEEKEKARADLSEEEYREKYGRDDDSATVFSEFRPTDGLKMILRDLVARGIIEKRVVQADAFDAYNHEIYDEIFDKNAVQAYSYIVPEET